MRYSSGSGSLSGGAKEYFGVQPDLITYGKSLGGGLPVGVLVRQWQSRTDETISAGPSRRISVLPLRGTFNSHPYVMGAMTGSSCIALESPEIQALHGRPLTSDGTIAPNN